MIDSAVTQRTFTSTSRYLHAASASDLYLILTPTDVGGRDIAVLANQMYQQAKTQMHAQGYRIFCERLFATDAAMAEVLTGRDTALGQWGDAVKPTCIIMEEGELGTFAGIQIHAVKSAALPMTVRMPDDNRTPKGRQLTIRGHKWLMLNAMSADVHATPADQTQQLFDEATALLNQSGGTFDSVARTWLWLKEVCDWYDDLNRVRTNQFIEHGLIDPKTKKSKRLPASTGIGLYGKDGAAITLDLIALPGREDEIQYIEAGGDQKSAYEYGSAFSRASIAPMPGGNTVFISGTAAIDEQGITEDLGKIKGQVDKTIAHVQSLLQDCGSDDDEVCFALVYCKTIAVQQYFLEQYADLGWPMITMLGDVCRDDLLFEVEVTAGQKDK